MSNNLVQQWKERAAQKAAARAAQIVSVPVQFGGFEGKAHRLNMLEWARAGRLPQYLATAMFAAVRGKSTEARKSDLQPEEVAEFLRFQCKAFCSMMDEPKFVDKPAEECSDDEMSYADFVMMCPEVINEAVQWQLNGCPDIPIQTEGGEMTLEELETFRDSGEWLSSPESFYHAEGLYWDTRPSPRNL